MSARLMHLYVGDDCGKESLFLEMTVMTRRTPRFLLVATTTYVSPVLYRDLGVAISMRNPEDPAYEERPVTMEELAEFDGLVFWVNPTTNIEFLQYHMELAKKCDDLPLMLIRDETSVTLPQEFQHIPHQLNFRNAVMYLLPAVPHFHPPVVVPVLAPV